MLYRPKKLAIDMFIHKKIISLHQNMVFFLVILSAFLSIDIRLINGCAGF
jgi:hypothetical protein